MSDNSISAQLARVRKVLKEAVDEGLTVIQLREDYDCMMPSTRVHELRHKEGLNIQTIWDRARNAQGNEHKTARYILLSGHWEGLSMRNLKMTDTAPYTAAGWGND